MKTRLGIAIAAIALAATVTTLMAAGIYQREPTATADALPAYEILNAVRALGFTPTSQALRRGPYYVLHAVDRAGLAVRVVADAQLGDVVSIAPLQRPRYDAGPRIIHVPQPGEQDERASINENDEEALPGEDRVERRLPPVTPRNTVRRPYQRTDLPPPPPPPPPPPLGPQRTLLSAPPPVGSLTPVYPTPNFAKTDPNGKFTAPQEAVAPPPPPPPPPGYTPLAAPRD